MRPVRKADNLPSYRAIVRKSGSFNFLDPSGPARTVMGQLYQCLFFPFTFTNTVP